MRRTANRSGNLARVRGRNMTQGSLNRRAFLTRSGQACAALGVLSAGGLLAGCNSAASSANSSSSGGTVHVSLQESYLNNAEFAGYYIAAKKGYFAKYGLDVNIIAAGATFQANPGCLMVLAKSDIFSVKDLEGKTIGMQDDARQQVLGILQSNGVPVGKVNLQVVGDDPTPLVLGKIDAYTAYAFNEPIALKMQGISTRCYSFSSIGLRGYGANLIANSDTIKSSPDMLARFIKASQQAWAY